MPRGHLATLAASGSFGLDWPRRGTVTPGRTARLRPQAATASLAGAPPPLPRGTRSRDRAGLGRPVTVHIKRGPPGPAAPSRLA
jgi:hypothetical protein